MDSEADGMDVEFRRPGSVERSGLQEEERLSFPLSSGVDDSPAITAVDRVWIDREVWTTSDLVNLQSTRY